MEIKAEILAVIIAWLEEERQKPGGPYLKISDPSKACIDGTVDLTALAERIAKNLLQ